MSLGKFMIRCLPNQTLPPEPCHLVSHCERRTPTPDSRYAETLFRQVRRRGDTNVRKSIATSALKSPRSPARASLWRVGQALATEAIAECIRSGRVGEAESNIGLL